MQSETTIGSEKGTMSSAEITLLFIFIIGKLTLKNSPGGSVATFILLLFFIAFYVEQM